MAPSDQTRADNRRLRWKSALALLRTLPPPAEVSFLYDLDRQLRGIVFTPAKAKRAIDF